VGSEAADPEHLVEPVADVLVADAGGVVALSGLGALGALDAVLFERCGQGGVDLLSLVCGHALSLEPVAPETPKAQTLGMSAWASGGLVCSLWVRV
jgi:hypothetical protein